MSADDSTRLAEIRGLLAAFDWEFDDKQYALEQIGQIVDGCLTGCTEACWTPVRCPVCGSNLPPRGRCPVCGSNLPPRGRSMSPEMGITDCCDEARMNAKLNPRHLWSEDELDDV